jgi:hypothetical protein
MKKRSKVEVPLFKKDAKRGRPIKYDFSPFKRQSVKHIVFQGVSAELYSSLRSTFARWRRIEGVEGRFRYDFLDDDSVAIWRQ